MKSDGPQPDASPAWARFYNEVGGRFATSVAPRIRELDERTETGRSNRSLLDVCCGTGQLARHFLDDGYRVTGIDLSEAMLHYARANAGDHLHSGRARFICADASDFQLNREFGLATTCHIFAPQDHANTTGTVIEGNRSAGRRVFRW